MQTLCLALLLAAIIALLCARVQQGLQHLLHAGRLVFRRRRF
jgi:hypothetical protein